MWLKMQVLQMGVCRLGKGVGIEFTRLALMQAHPREQLKILFG